MNEVRIYKVDSYNVAVQRLNESECTSIIDGKRVKTGETKTVWETEGYYGHRIDQAAKVALFEAVTEGEVVTPELLEKLATMIVNQTKDALNVRRKE